MSRLRKRFMDCSGLSMEEAESFGNEFCVLMRDLPFYLGDLVRYCKARWPDTWEQCFHIESSVGMLERYCGVAKLYPKESDRAYEATFTQYAQNARKPNREQILQHIVNEGLTTDESRKIKLEQPTENRPRWLIAFDTSYYISRWYHSGCGVETAMELSKWIQRTVERLKAKGATDCVCAFEGSGSFRKKLTEDWEDKYKGKRGPKDPEKLQQIQLSRELLTNLGFCCVSVDEYEADDILASYAHQFPGKTTIVSSDKDLRCCLSDTCNILLDVTWEESEEYGDNLPTYHWLTAKSHTEETGLIPAQFVEYQVLMGDPVDCISGSKGIGETGAKNLILEFGSAEAAIEAAKSGDERLLSMKRGSIMQASLIEFEPKLAITRKLVELVTDLELPNSTRI